jgi:SAM-dependent methyltransferase
MNQSSAKSAGEDTQTLVCPKHHSPLFRNETALFCRAGKPSTFWTAFPALPTDRRMSTPSMRNGKDTDSPSWIHIQEQPSRLIVFDGVWDIRHGLTGKTVLECGCGAGRFTEVLLRRHCVVTSVDLSEAVEANQENFPQSESHKIIQADITRLPLPPQQFELVRCLGVLQHTPNPVKNGCQDL